MIIAALKLRRRRHEGKFSFSPLRSLIVNWSSRGRGIVGRDDSYAVSWRAPPPDAVYRPKAFTPGHSLSATPMPGYSHDLALMLPTPKALSLIFIILFSAFLRDCGLHSLRPSGDFFAPFQAE